MEQVETLNGFNLSRSKANWSAARVGQLNQKYENNQKQPWGQYVGEINEDYASKRK